MRLNIMSNEWVKMYPNLLLLDVYGIEYTCNVYRWFSIHLFIRMSTRLDLVGFFFAITSFANNNYNWLYPYGDGG